MHEKVHLHSSNEIVIGQKNVQNNQIRRKKSALSYRPYWTQKYKILCPGDWRIIGMMFKSKQVKNKKSKLKSCIFLK